MSKYDYSLDLSEKTSTGTIIRNIDAKSTILEFGCAEGRMTHYLSEIMHCKMYIVERDEAAFNTAVQYAEDGICDDIMNYSWLRKYSEIRFDYIIFADVLEHLSEAEKVLRTASELLKEDGTVFISVPNIAHNDIILKLLEDNFDYTTTGLLDDTHVHYWGYNNLKPFVEHCGLYIREIHPLYCAMGNTEQLIGKKIQVQEEWLNLFRERIAGEVYQFVIFAGKTCTEQKVELEDTRHITSHIYYDSGAGYNDSSVIPIDAMMISSGHYCVSSVIKHHYQSKLIRFDPIEFQPCIMKNISFHQSGKQLETVFNGAIEIDQNEYLFLTTDPKITVRLDSCYAPVIIEGEIIIFSPEYVRIITDTIVQRDKKIADMSKTIGELSNEIDRLSDKIADIPEIIEKEKANWDLKQQYALELQEDKISNLKNEMKFLKKEYDTAVNELKKSEEKAENQNILLQKTQEKLAFVKQIEIIKELYLRDQTEKIKHLNLSKGELEELKTLCISQKEEISRLEKMNVQLRKLVIQKDQLVVKKATASRERQD